MTVIHVKSKDEFDKSINDSNFKATIVDFSATWCGPCQYIGPIFEENSKKYAKILFLKVDVDELNDVSSAEGIRAMPTFRVYQNGKKVEEIVGADVEALVKALDKFSQ